MNHRHCASVCIPTLHGIVCERIARFVSRIIADVFPEENLGRVAPISESLKAVVMAPRCASRSSRRLDGSKICASVRYWDRLLRSRACFAAKAIVVDAVAAGGGDVELGATHRVSLAV